MSGNEHNAGSVGDRQTPSSVSEPVMEEARDARGQQQQQQEEVGVEASADPTPTPTPQTTSSKMPSRRHGFRKASINFYASVDNVSVCEPMQSQDYRRSKAHVHLSRKFPVWLLNLLAQLVGVKIQPNDTPLVGTIFHMITLTLAFGFSITGAWYTVCDILSKYSRTTVLVGSVTIIIGLAYVGIGIYANKLSGRLISNKNFSESVRMHSRTVFKINAFGLLAVFSIVLTGVNCFHTWTILQSDSCEAVGLSPYICTIQFACKLGFGMLSLLWNLLVGFVLLSVCRTHTIGIRRFIRQLELDGHAYEIYWKEKSQQQRSVINTSKLISDLSLENYTLDEDCGSTEEEETSCTPNMVKHRQPAGSVFTAAELLNPAGVYNLEHAASLGEVQDFSEDPPAPEMITQVWRNDASVLINWPVKKKLSSMTDDGPPLMSNEEILLSYWKISWRMRVTSRYLQRWLASWIALIVIWCGNYIIYWTNHDATLAGILEFLLPLFLLLLLTSAFAEANAEGQRMIRCMCPTEDRIMLLLFLNQQPLQMQVFNFALTFNAIVGVLLAFAVAFASKIIMDEVL